MRHSSSTAVLVASAAFVCIATSASPAQSTPATVKRDALWTPWLGCWAPDTASADGRAASPNTTCIVPVAASRAVDLLTIVRGAIVMRDRLDASGRSHAIDNLGCAGSENVNSSPAGRRLYLRSTYTCTGDTPGSSTTIFAFLPGGQVLRVEQVRSGDGSIGMVDRLHSVRVPDVVPVDAVRAIERQQLAVTTSRARASVPVTADEIIDAAEILDVEAVETWALATGQRFEFNDDERARLARTGMPAPVVNALAGSSAMDATRNVDVSMPEPMSASAYGGQGAESMTTLRVCPWQGCYSTNRYSVYNGYGYDPAIIYPYAAYSYPLYYRTSPVGVRGGLTRPSPIRPQPRPIRAQPHVQPRATAPTSRRR